MTQITGVAFDLMDTLVHDPWRAGLAAAFGTNLDAAIANREPSAWPRFERGEITETQFWATHAEHNPDPEACRRVRREQTAWLPGMRDLVQDVKDAGIAIALASNYPTWFEDIEELDLLDDLFETTIVSYRIGARKPDAPFYDAVAEGLDLAHDQVVFVDDRQGNVDGAMATGMDGILFSGADDLRAALVSRGLVI